MAMRLGALPSQIEAEGPDVLATMLDLLSPRSSSNVDSDEDVDVLWPVEAMA